MSNQLFKNFPEIQYTLSTGKIVTIKDFFRKSTIEQESVNSVISYTFYEIQDGERPDVVADRLYGDSDLHWTFFLVNEMDNYYQWYKGWLLIQQIRYHHRLISCRQVLSIF